MTLLQWVLIVFFLVGVLEGLAEFIDGKPCRLVTLEIGTKRPYRNAAKLIVRGIFFVWCVLAWWGGGA